MFWLVFVYVKNYKSIARTDFLNVNIALNLHSYEENVDFYMSSYEFLLEFMKSLSFVAL